MRFQSISDHYQWWIEQLGGIRSRIGNTTEVTAASHTTRIAAAKKFNQRQSDFDLSFVIPPKRNRGLAKMLYSFLSAATRQKTALVDNLDQALQQLYGPAIVEQKSAAAKGSKSELIEQNSRLRQ